MKLGPYTLVQELLLFYEPMRSLVFWSATRAAPDGPEACTLALPRHDLPEIPSYLAWVEDFERDADVALRFQHPAILRARTRGRVGHIPFLELEPFAGVTIAALRTGSSTPEKMVAATRASAGLPMRPHDGKMVAALDGADMIRAALPARGLPSLVVVEIVRQLAAATAHLCARCVDQDIERRGPALQVGTVLCARDGGVRLLPPFHVTWLREAPSFMLWPSAYELGLFPPDDAPDERSYVFLLGTILYCLATGWRPPENRLELAAIERMLLDFPAPSALAPGAHTLDEVVRAATAIDPAQRYPNLERLAYELTALLEPLAASSGASRAQPPSDGACGTRTAAAAARAEIARLVVMVDGRDLGQDPRPEHEAAR